MAAPDAALRAAWQATEYRVQTPTTDLALRIGRRDAGLADLLARAGVDCAAYVTADNPHSQIVPEADNRRARQRLRAAVTAAGWRCLAGEGVNPHGEHPGEQSLLVLGIDEHDAMALGRRFGQHAILVIGADATPRLRVLE